MKKGILFKVVALVLVICLVTACSSSSKDEKSDVTSSRDDRDSSSENTGSDYYKDEKSQTETSIEYKESIDGHDSETDSDKPTSELAISEEASVANDRYDDLELEDGASVYFEPVSTFSVDVDTASYSMVRNDLRNGYIPYASDIRIEELVNYFEYDYETPSDAPFSIQTEVGLCPWNEDYVIASIGLNGKEIEMDERPSTNLVFLMDVSGSMNDPDKLPLLKESFKLLVNELGENDRVSIVVYAGASGTVLDGARGNQKEKILDALDELEAGGSTAGSEGIVEAYRIARKHFINNGNNRVILATDGDFNVGLTSEDALLKLIEEKREDGIFLSALGFGSGGRDFDTMELLADNGNGHFAYIDSEREARRVMIEELGGTLYTIAKDVKVQVEFNPAVVKEYNLIGYENRVLENHEFNDDKVDAGDIGAGHQVTALYLIKLVDYGLAEGEELRYSDNQERDIEEMMFVKLRYKEPDEDTSKLLTHVVDNEIDKYTSNNFNFAVAVAEFGLALRGDFQYSGENFEKLYDDTLRYIMEDPDTYKIEFVELISLASRMMD